MLIDTDNCKVEDLEILVKTLRRKYKNAKSDTECGEEAHKFYLVEFNLLSLEQNITSMVMRVKNILK